MVDVEVVLARPATALPGDGWAFEPKWDGWRGVLSRRRLVSRHGKDLSRLFPELVDRLSEGTVLDGEIVCWADGRQDFAGLHRRRTGGTRSASSPSMFSSITAAACVTFRTGSAA